MSKRAWPLLIEDIIESGNKILSYTDNMEFEDFVSYFPEEAFKLNFYRGCFFETYMASYVISTDAISP